MHVRWSLFIAKLRFGTQANFKILRDWRYALLAATVAVFFWLFLYWSLNLSFLWFVIASGRLALVLKLKIIFGSTLTILADKGVALTVATVALSLLQGAVISILIFVVKSQQAASGKAVGVSAIASLLAVFSVGCVSCGTSIIAPLFGIFFAGTAASLGTTIQNYIAYPALAATLYAFYAVGINAANTLARPNSGI